jgi:hypothetical protein
VFTLYGLPADKTTSMNDQNYDMCVSEYMLHYAPLSNTPAGLQVSRVIREIKLLLYDLPDIEVVKIFF